MGKELAVHVGSPPPRPPCYSPGDARVSAVREPKSRRSRRLRGLRRGAGHEGPPSGGGEPEANHARTRPGRRRRATRAANPRVRAHPRGDPGSAAEPGDRAADTGRDDAGAPESLRATVFGRPAFHRARSTTASAGSGVSGPTRGRLEAHDARLRVAGHGGVCRAAPAVAGARGSGSTFEPRRDAGVRERGASTRGTRAGVSSATRAARSGSCRGAATHGAPADDARRRAPWDRAASAG